MDDLIKALTIFEQYMKEKAKPSQMIWPTNCNHDELFVDCRVEWIPPDVLPELEALGFIVDEDNDGFVSYRFGSC